jgi:hypothetical protein
MSKHQKKSPELSVVRCSQGLAKNIGEHPTFKGNTTTLPQNVNTPSITVRWQPIREISPNWRKLWHLLLAGGVK